MIPAPEYTRGAVNQIPLFRDEFPDSYALMEHSDWVWNDLYQQSQILVL